MDLNFSMAHLVGWKNERFNTTLPHILTGLYLNCVGKDIQENAMTTYSPMFVPIGAKMVYTDPKTGKETVLFDFTDLDVDENGELVEKEAKKPHKKGNRRAE